MLRRLTRRLTYANVMSTIAVFGVLAGGTAYAANTIRSGDIVDGEITTTDVRDDTQGFGGLFAQDLAAGSVGTSEIGDRSVRNYDINDETIDGINVQNGSLNDVDVGKGTFNNYDATVGTVPAQSCRDFDITGVNAVGDHLLLEANANTASPGLSYTVEYRNDSNNAKLKVCNPTTLAINDGNTRFNLLVFDAT